ncbi:MAG: hypothetical protein ACRDL5_04690 [Solirubrobacteraceae bacterium]
MVGEGNAAVELIEEGVNGFVAPSASASDLADAIERVHGGGQRLRDSTAAWFASHAERLSLEGSLETVLTSYGGHDADCSAAPWGSAALALRALGNDW